MHKFSKFISKHNIMILIIGILKNYIIEQKNVIFIGEKINTLLLPLFLILH